MDVEILDRNHVPHYYDLVFTNSADYDAQRQTVPTRVRVSLVPFTTISPMNEP